MQILAIRDEFVSRDFDEPEAWWPQQPDVVGGRDRLAGGTWCASDVAAGTTALVLNRTERHTGTPSRGVLPLAALEHGAQWPQHLDVTDMASFSLVLAGTSDVTAWIWDAVTLQQVALEPGLHVFTSRGVDAGDEKTARWTPVLAETDWLDVLTSAPPADDRTALVVRHEFETDTYATVFGQLITASPGRLTLRYSRTPWERGSWRERQFSTAS